MTMIRNTPRSVRTYTSLPGNSDVVVSHDMRMHPEFIGKGFAKQEQWESIQMMSQLGFKYALCTVSGDNIKQIKVLTHTGWTCLASFKNDCEETVHLYGKHVHE